MTQMRSRTRHVLVAATTVAALAVAGTACTSTSGHDVSPALHAASCPDDVELHLLVSHTCWTLRVPEDRSAANGRTATVRVVRVVPPGTAATDPVLNLGSEPGDALAFGGFGALAERLHRAVFFMQTRGSGLSTPSLACPEAASVRATDADEPAELTAAARACLTRLRAAGDDPAWFGPSDVAADVEDLRRAVGVEQWNVITYGGASVYAAAVLRAHPGTVRSLVLDSPAPLTGPYADAAATWTSWQRVAAACRTAAVCKRAAGGPAALWTAAAAAVTAHPVTVAGRPDMRLTADGLARLVRATLEGEGPGRTASVPALLAAVRQGSLPPDAAALLAADTGGCVGVHPLCSHQNSLAAYLSAMCPLLAVPSTTAAPAVPGLAALDPVAMFGTVCADWPARQPGALDLPPGLPVLVLLGQYDPFTDQASLAGWRGGTHTYVVELPGQTHNALGFDDCPISLRNAWVDQPQAPPPTDCVATMPALAFPH